MACSAEVLPLIPVVLKELWIVLDIWIVLHIYCFVHAGFLIYAKFQALYWHMWQWRWLLGHGRMSCWGCQTHPSGNHSRFYRQPCATLGQDWNTSLSCFANSITKQRGGIQPRDISSHALNFQLVVYSNWALQNCPRLSSLVLEAGDFGAARMQQHSWQIAVKRAKTLKWIPR